MRSTCLEKKISRLLLIVYPKNKNWDKFLKIISNFSLFSPRQKEVLYIVEKIILKENYATSQKVKG